MRFSVNFYIHILDHPLLIIKNFELPLRNLHLSYHNESHYNSVRLKEDPEQDIPLDIPLELINCLEHTTNAQVIADDDLDSDEEDHVSTGKKEEKSIVEEKTCIINEEPDQEIVSFGIVVKDINQRTTTRSRIIKWIMTKDGIVMNEISEHKKCHCKSNKKYRNCCLDDDIKGEYNKSEQIFYCDLEDFKKRFFYEIRNSNEGGLKKTNSKNEVESIVKRVDSIYI